MATAIILTYLVGVVLSFGRVNAHQHYWSQILPNCDYPIEEIARTSLLSWLGFAIGAIDYYKHTHLGHEAFLYFGLDTFKKRK